MVNGLMNELQPGERLYANLPGLRVIDNPPSTIPAKILNTHACYFLALSVLGFVVFAHFSLKSEAGFSPCFSSAAYVSNTILT